MATISQTPQGLHYFPNFLTVDEGKHLFDSLLQSSQWTPVSAYDNARRVIQYGYTYSYTGGPLKVTEPIPQELINVFITKFHDPKWKSLVSVLDDGSDHPEQLIINRYLPGQGIAPHIDHLINFGDVITCITLGSGVTIKFTRPGYQTYSIYVEPNSVYVMSGDARFEWKHSIDANKTDTVNNKVVKRGTRMSLTFRTVNKNAVSEN
jgi:alkylated DNA repair protein alkB family protein 8